MPIVTCPTCGTKLEIAPEDVGYKVQCGGCQGVFEAQEEKSNRSRIDDEDLPPSKRNKYRREDDDEDDDDYDDRPRRRRSRYDADERADPSRQPGQGLGVASMILGICSLVVTGVGLFCPLVVIVGFVCAVLSIIFGIMALKTDGKGLGIAGIIMSTLTFLLGIAGIILIAFYLSAMGVAGGAGAAPVPPAGGAGGVMTTAPNPGGGDGGITPRIVTKPGQPAPKQFQPITPGK